jgi:hypothetical protein
MARRYKALDTATGEEQWLAEAALLTLPSEAFILSDNAGNHTLTVEVSGNLTGNRTVGVTADGNYTINLLGNLTLGGGGIVLQAVYTESKAQVSSTAIVPGDDTVPQWSEFGEHAALETTITPQRSDSYLDIVVSVPLAASTSAVVLIGLFRDSDADSVAVAADYFQSTGAYGYVRTILHARVPSSSTSATTFKVGIGKRLSSGTVYANDAATAAFGGTQISSIKISEVTP